MILKTVGITFFLDRLGRKGREQRSPRHPRPSQYLHFRFHSRVQGTQDIALFACQARQQKAAESKAPKTQPLLASQVMLNSVIYQLCSSSAADAAAPPPPPPTGCMLLHYFKLFDMATTTTTTARLHALALFHSNPEGGCLLALLQFIHMSTPAGAAMAAPPPTPPQIGYMLSPLFIPVLARVIQP
eukprot:5122340-Amphidinium_carterae.1